jgi:hypothetical protein
MPGYKGLGRAKLILANEQKFLWQNETVPAGAANGSLSEAWQIERARSVHYPWGFSVEVSFSGNPGAFEVDVMVADTDNPNNFIQWTNITQANPTNVGRADVLNSWAKYVAVYLKTLTNSVTVTAQLTR